MRKPQGIRSLNNSFKDNGLGDAENLDKVENQTQRANIQSILVVDPDPDFSSTVSDYLKLFGYQISHQSNIESALETVQEKPIDVIFLADNFDFHHPIDVLRRFKSVAPTSLIAILANKGDDQLAVELLKSGADDYLSRRVKDKDILTSIANLLEKLAESVSISSNFQTVATTTQQVGEIFEPKQHLTIAEQSDESLFGLSSYADSSALKSTQVLDFLPGLLLVLDENLDITYLNQRCAEWLGYGQKDIQNQPIDMLVPKQVYSELVRELKSYCNKIVSKGSDTIKSSNLFELIINPKQGEGIPVRCQISLFNRNTTDIEASELAHDVEYLLTLEDLRSEKEKQAEMLYLSMWNTLLRAFAHRFINLKLENFSQELSGIVSETANFFKLDRVSIYLFDKNKTKARIYLEWLKKDVESLKIFSKKIDVEAGLIEFEKMLNGETQIIEPVAVIQESDIDQGFGLSEHYAQVNSMSTAVLPIRKNSETIGWLAMDYQSEERHWWSSDIEVVEPLAQLVSEAFTRRAQEEHRKVTHQKLSENHGRLSEQAFLDGLTKLANRRYFDKVLESEVRRASRDKSNIALLFCDVDYFKAYNDTYGHIEGDVCLKAIASVLKQEFQRAGDFVARFGGEEFAVILSGTLANDALESAEKLRQHIESMNIEHQGSPLGKIALSIGISSIVSPDANDAKKLLSKADKALYKAKTNGRNRVEVSPFSPR
jgi:diguanylate cyclase (GGDEF)-like protein